MPECETALKWIYIRFGADLYLTWFSMVPYHADWRGSMPVLISWGLTPMWIHVDAT